MTRTESVCSAAILAYLATSGFTPTPTVFNDPAEAEVVPRVSLRVKQGHDTLAPLGAYELAVQFEIFTDAKAESDTLQSTLEQLFLESSNYLQPLVEELTTSEFSCNGLVQGEGTETDAAPFEGEDGIRRATNFQFLIIGSDLTRFVPSAPSAMTVFQSGNNLELIYTAAVQSPANYTLNVMQSSDGITFASVFTDTDSNPPPAGSSVYSSVIIGRYYYATLASNDFAGNPASATVQSNTIHAS